MISIKMSTSNSSKTPSTLTDKAVAKMSNRPLRPPPSEIGKKPFEQETPPGQVTTLKKGPQEKAHVLRLKRLPPLHTPGVLGSMSIGRKPPTSGHGALETLESPSSSQRPLPFTKTNSRSPAKLSTHPKLKVLQASSSTGNPSSAQLPNNIPPEQLSEISNLSNDEPLIGLSWSKIEDYVNELMCTGNSTGLETSSTSLHMLDEFPGDKGHAISSVTRRDTSVSLGTHERSSTLESRSTVKTSGAGVIIGSVTSISTSFSESMVDYGEPDPENEKRDTPQRPPVVRVPAKMEDDRVSEPQSSPDSVDKLMDFLKSRDLPLETRKTSIATPTLPSSKGESSDRPPALKRGQGQLSDWHLTPTPLRLRKKSVSKVITPNGVPTPDIELAVGNSMETSQEGQGQIMNYVAHSPMTQVFVASREQVRRVNILETQTPVTTSQQVHREPHAIQASRSQQPPIPTSPSPPPLKRVFTRRTNIYPKNDRAKRWNNRYDFLQVPPESVQPESVIGPGRIKWTFERGFQSKWVG